MYPYNQGSKIPFLIYSNSLPTRFVDIHVHVYALCSAEKYYRQDFMIYLVHVIKKSIGHSVYRIDLNLTHVSSQTESVQGQVKIYRSLVPIN